VKIKNIVLVAAALISLTLLFFSSGLFWPVRPPFLQESFPKDLDAYLAEREAKAGTVRPGFEKQIIWADRNSKTRSKYSIVYLHGFSASRHELSPLIEELAQELQANVFFTRLSAHGLTDSAERFQDLTADDLFRDAYEAGEIGRKIGEQPIIIATSTGTALALYLAANYADLHALVLLSPNYRPRDARARLLAGPAGRLLARLLIGEYRSFEPINDRQKELWTTRYRSEGVVAMMDLLKYVEGLNLTQVSTPSLTVYTESDDVVDLQAILQRSRELRAARGSRIFDGSGIFKNHILAGDAISPEGTKPLKREILNFIRSLPQ